MKPQPILAGLGAAAFLAASAFALLAAGPPVEAKGFPKIDGQAVAITLRREACYGTCPIYSVTINGDGRVVYQGDLFVAATGRRTRQIPPAKVRRLIEQFRAADFYALKDSYGAVGNDWPSQIVSLRIGRRSKTVTDNRDHAPRSLTDLETAIDRVAGTADWVGSQQKRLP